MAVERVDIEHAGSPWHEEHLSRYVFARDYFNGKKVLDIACGTGFGSEFILSQHPAFLYCADVSEEAIEITKSRLEQHSDRVEVGFQDGTNLKFDNDSFDVVISIETVEHIDADLKFLDEIKRVLRPGGVLIISTPNGDITNPGQGKPSNPFHVREDRVEDFQQKLKERFKIKNALGQDVVDSYGPAPFLPSYDKKYLTRSQKIKALGWSLRLRFPEPLRSKMNRLITSHDFYPSVEEYTFLPKDLNKAHVQYYICENS